MHPSKALPNKALPSKEIFKAVGSDDMTISITRAANESLPTL